MGLFIPKKKPQAGATSSYQPRDARGRFVRFNATDLWQMTLNNLTTGEVTHFAPTTGPSILGPFPNQQQKPPAGFFEQPVPYRKELSDRVAQRVMAAAWIMRHLPNYHNDVEIELADTILPGYGFSRCRQLASEIDTFGKGVGAGDGLLPEIKQALTRNRKDERLLSKRSEVLLMYDEAAMILSDTDRVNSKRLQALAKQFRTNQELKVEPFRDMKVGPLQEVKVGPFQEVNQQKQKRGKGRGRGRGRGK